MKDRIATIIESIGLSVSFVFVPFSASRNAGEKYKSLNYKATVFHRGRKIFTCDYMQGQAHCPAYTLPGGMSPHDKWQRQEMINNECETGIIWKKGLCCDIGFNSGKRIPAPHVADFFYSIVADSDVLDYCSFEDWAENFGYGSDSRKAEDIYRECIKHGLALRNAIGHDVLEKLRAEYQDY